MGLKAELLNRLDSIITKGEHLIASYYVGYMGATQSDISEVDFREFAIAARAAILGIAGGTSEYYTMLPDRDDNAALSTPGFSNTQMPSMVGSLKALRTAVDCDYLVSLDSRLRANIHVR